MSKLLNLIAITIVFIFILFSLSLAEEQITITTYYPSPYGSYQDLEVIHKLRAKGRGADADLAIHATTNLGKTAVSSASGTYAIYGEILNTTDPDVTDGVSANVVGGLGKVWTVGGKITQAGVYGSAPLYGTDQYAGYFDGNVLMRCIVVTYGSMSGYTECPVGTTFNSALTPSWTPTGGIFYCCRW